MNGVCSGLGIMNFPDGSKYEKRRCLHNENYFMIFIADTKENLCKDGFMAVEFSFDLME